MDKKKSSRAVLALLPVLLPLLLLVFSQTVDRRAGSEARESLQRAVHRAAVQCYALEGFYPTKLAYLEENYGVTIDKTRFYVDYQYIASNLIPDITVLSVRG